MDKYYETLIVINNYFTSFLGRDKLDIESEKANFKEEFLNVSKLGC